MDASNLFQSLTKGIHFSHKPSIARIFESTAGFGQSGVGGSSSSIRTLDFFQEQSLLNSNSDRSGAPSSSEGHRKRARDADIQDVPHSKKPLRKGKNDILTTVTRSPGGIGQEDNSSSSSHSDNDTQVSALDMSVSDAAAVEKFETEFPLFSTLQSESAVAKLKMEMKKNQSLLSAEDRQVQNLVNRFRRENRISVAGVDVAEPLDSWAQMAERYGLRKFLITNLDKLSFKDPSPVQMQAIPVQLSRRNLLAVAPTGSGKTAAYLLPLLARLKKPAKSSRQGVRAVVLCPTLELARQIYEHTRKLMEGKDFRVFQLGGSGQSNLTGRQVDIVISTPLRLLYRVHDGSLPLNNVKFLVVDEVDKLLDLGFRGQVAQIVEQCTDSELQISMWSATVTSQVEQLAVGILKDPVEVVVGHRGAASEHIKQSLMFVGDEDGKYMALRRILNGGGHRPPILIFVQSKERARELYREMVFDGWNVDAIHADRTKAQREETIRNFRTGKLWILVTTDLLARGIDISCVNLVVNYDFPQSSATYIHRIGRTGRAGREGAAVTLFCESDIPYLRSIVSVLRSSGCEVPDWMLDLKRVTRKEKAELRHGLDRGSVKVAAGSEIKPEKKEIRRRQILRKRSRKVKKSSQSQSDNGSAGK